MCAAPYQEPEWAVQPPPIQEWTLIEIKGGVEVTRHALHTRPTTVLGRAIDMVHIPLHHESASRQHARIAFDADGIPWLKDLQSTHGVTVNKRKLPAESISKTESNGVKKGSRGVMIFPGDILQFGASTRFYTLEGPPEFDRGAIQAKLQQGRWQQQQQQLPQRTHQSEENERPSKNNTKLDEGAYSWGISMSDEDENDDDDHDGADGDDRRSDNNKTLPMDVHVPEKHRKALEKLNAMKYKLANLETEDSRIRRKGELTEGQEKQLQRNAEREETLRRSIADQEETLFDKLYPNNKEKRSARRQRNHGTNGNAEEDEDDDEFFDRTRSQDSLSSDAVADMESETSLVVKWKTLVEQRSQLRSASLPLTEKRLVDLQDRLDQSEAIGSEDAFFIQNDLQLAKESKDKVLASISDCDAAIQDVAKLLTIVNPKMHLNTETGYIGEGLPPPSTNDMPTNEENGQNALPPPASTKEMPPPNPSGLRPTLSSGREENQHISASMPPPPPSTKMVSDTTTAATDLPAPKRQRVVGPVMPPPLTSTSQTTTERKPSLSQKQQGTLAFLNNMTKMQDSDAEMSSGTTRPSSKETSKVSATAARSSKEDVWQAPVDQDGSGRTKLNEKFAGRY